MLCFMPDLDPSCQALQIAIETQDKSGLHLIYIIMWAVAKYIQICIATKPPNTILQHVSSGSQKVFFGSAVTDKSYSGHPC